MTRQQNYFYFLSYTAGWRSRLDNFSISIPSDCQAPYEELIQHLSNSYYGSFWAEASKPLWCKFLNRFMRWKHKTGWEESCLLFTSTKKAKQIEKLIFISSRAPYNYRHFSNSKGLLQEFQNLNISCFARCGKLVMILNLKCQKYASSPCSGKICLVPIGYLPS